ncbi:hypothetical protein [Asticcacaulis taihuensis]|uniref:hypothetical protein n=1 Tax=Asticcacaulis taihuensis TaxID=260084 RepID=UPI0026F0D018|nr:hypothetical protein [Asticcacaulis taihuensis]
MDFSAGQVETQASAYWRQRVQAVESVAGQARRKAAFHREAGRDTGHGPALFVTLSPVGQAQLDALRRELTAQRARR